MSTDTTELEPRPPTEVELRIVHLVVDGNTNGQIATALRMAEDTVKTHLRRLFVAWSVTTRMELAQFAIRHGWVACPNCAHSPESVRLLTTAANTLRQLASNLDVSAGYIVHGGASHG